ncbi:crotonase/enoyl-CoA hydratase family protein [Hansschlegelia sp. KR7-227]|jgi:DSF synthase|uniref:crotonase/enoyl-CoA hydratase family protein n=1 Tax=Hansschlegelia sp. KR7-227 TaxID=3400914 RepID=UPI003C0651B7
MATPLSLTDYEPFSGLERARRRLRDAVATATTSLKGAEAQPAPATRGGYVPGVYDEIDVEFDASDGTAWCWMNPHGAPSFTVGMLEDLRTHCRDMRDVGLRAPSFGASPIKHSVLASRIPGIFNLGGDLASFTRWIRTGDRKNLTAYARACIDVSHDNSGGFGGQTITISLVQGDALGGGLESALSSHMVVAERGVKFGMPEILFNLFPGMGAYSLLARKLGAAGAERLIMSGKLYTAEEFYEMGLVHVLAEPGDGVAETHRLIQRNLRRRNGLLAIEAAARRVNKLDYDELRDVTDIWIEAALCLSASDLRKMERLASAQDKRVAAGFA